MLNTKIQDTEMRKELKFACLKNNSAGVNKILQNAEVIHRYQRIVAEMILLTVNLEYLETLEVLIRFSKELDISQLFYFAIDAEDEAMVVLLSKHGASIEDTLSSEGKPPLIHALDRGKWALASSILSIAKEEERDMRKFINQNHNNSKPPLFCLLGAITYPDFVLQDLLEHGADCNAEWKEEFPLEIATRTNNVELVQILLKHGARPLNS
jgi:ankyrin repeat protein